MATKKNLKLSKPQLKQPDMAPIDAVRNPNFPTALAQQDYMNNLAQSLENYQSQNYPTGGTAEFAPNPNVPNLMPIGGLGIQQGSEEQRRMALNQGVPSGSGMGGQIPTPNMPQNKMADFNNLLQQGMQRNQDFNQAAQNFAGMGGPQKSFSQVAGGIGKMNRMPKQLRPNSIAPSNQKLI